MSKNKDKSRGLLANEELMEKLQQEGSFSFLTAEDKVKYASMSSRDITKVIKKGSVGELNYLLHAPVSITGKHLEKIVKRYRKASSLRKCRNPEIKARYERKRISLLSFIAVHPLVGKKSLKELAKNDSSAVRFAVAQNASLSTKNKKDIYTQLIKNHANGSRSVLLQVIFSPDLSWELVNKGLQELFSKGEYIDIPFPLWKNIRYFTAEVSDEGNLNGRTQEQWNFGRNLASLSSRDGISVKTLKIILNSRHSGAIISLCGNKYLTGKMHEILAESQGFLKLERMPQKYLDGSLPAFAGNSSVPGKLLATITESIIPELSYKRRGAAYNETAVALANNPATPLASLLTLRSLHNDVEYQKYATTGEYNREAEIFGTPLELYRAVEANPTYLEWVKETPNYKEFLPEFIPCPCHGL